MLHGQMTLRIRPVALVNEGAVWALYVWRGAGWVLCFRGLRTLRW